MRNLLWVLAGFVALFWLFSNIGDWDLFDPERPDNIPVIAATELFAEREANAVRFDETRKGKWVTVVGRVGHVESDRVLLPVDAWGLSNVVLQNLPTDALSVLDIGDGLAATCVVGDFIIVNMFMERCTLEHHEPAS